MSASKNIFLQTILSIEMFLIFIKAFCMYFENICICNLKIFQLENILRLTKNLYKGNTLSLHFAQLLTNPNHLWEDRVWLIDCSYVSLVWSPGNGSVSKRRF